MDETVHEGEKHSRFFHYYDKKYKKLMWITIVMFILAIAQIGYQIATTGDFVNKGISLKGGSTITIPKSDFSQHELEQHLLSRFPGIDISVRTLSQAGRQIGLIIDTDERENIQDIVTAVKEKITLAKDDYSVEEMGSSLGESFFKETFIAIIIAFVCMGLVVLYYFRIFVPSLAVIIAALADIIETLAIFNLLGLKLSTAGVAAFLMLIGYSVDTDILLTTKVIKRKQGSVMYRIKKAMSTGLTMTFTTIIAVSIGLIFTQSDVIRQIMTILLIGLILDIPNTWIQNVGLLRLHLEKKNKPKVHHEHHVHTENGQS